MLDCAFRRVKGFTHFEGDRVHPLLRIGELNPIPFAQQSTAMLCARRRGVRSHNR